MLTLPPSVKIYVSRGASGAGSERAWARSGAGAGDAAAVSLSGLRGGAGRGAARALAAPVVQRWGGRAGAAGVRRGREKRERAGSDKPLAVGRLVSGRALGDADALDRGGAACSSGCAGSPRSRREAWPGRSRRCSQLAEDASLVMLWTRKSSSGRRSRRERHRVGSARRPPARWTARAGAARGSRSTENDRARGGSEPARGLSGRRKRRRRS